MSETQGLAEIVEHPFATGLQGARLQALHEESTDAGSDLVLDYDAFTVTSSELFMRDARVYERVEGYYSYSRLRFKGISDLINAGTFIETGFLPFEDPNRTLVDLFSWRQPDHPGVVFYMLILRSPKAPDLMFFARDVEYETFPSLPTPVTLERDWCPPPPMRAGPVPRPWDVYAQFGGDPVTVFINSLPVTDAFFVGGTDIQKPVRPSKIDFVLNLGEQASVWAKNAPSHPNDRWEKKGEGSEGMSVNEIRAEAEWVVERLKAGKRVLVHCVAGMNRSTTICCAALILLEGLTAEQSLARVREQHPWARPDIRHWLALRWLAGHR